MGSIKHGKNFNSCSKLNCLEFSGTRAYAVDAKESAIQNEIMDYGPVSAEIALYKDFLTYRSGISEKF